MRIEKNLTSSTIMEFKIILEKEEAEKEYNKSVRYFRNKYVIPGFRKGKAPLPMVKKMFKEAIDGAFEISVYENYFPKALQEENQNPINEPEMVSSKWENDEFEMVLKFEVMPEVKVEKYKGLEIEFPGEEYNEEILNKQIEEIRKQNATQEDVEEKAQEGFYINLEFYENKDDEKPIYKLENTYYSPAHFSKEMNDFLQNAKTGDTVDAVFDIEPFDKNAVNIIKKDKTYHIKLARIYKLNLPELNDEFAKDLEFDSFEDMKKKLEEDIIKYIDEKNKESKLTSVKLKLIEENPFDVPNTMVANYSKELASSYVQTSQDLDRIAPMFNEMAVFNIKSYFIRNEIIKMENLKVEDDDLEKLIKIEAEKLKMDSEEYKKLYKDRINSDNFKDRALDMKYDDFLLENNTFKLLKNKEEEKDNSKENKEDKAEKTEQTQEKQAENQE